MIAEKLFFYNSALASSLLVCYSADLDSLNHIAQKLGFNIRATGTVT